jgi:uncharacterized protein YndB with AHSA1/START domain
MTTSEPKGREFTLTWTLDASPADVFSDLDRSRSVGVVLQRRAPAAGRVELDLRVGGVWRQYMVIDEGTGYFTAGVYREIVPDENLVFSWSGRRMTGARSRSA